MDGTTVFAELSAREADRMWLKGDLTELKWMSVPEILRNRKIHPAHRQAAKNIAAGEFQP